MTRNDLRTCDPPLPVPTGPTARLPPGSCDSHCHVFGPFDRYPLPDDRSFNPALAPETALRALHDRLGIDRAVIVQSQGHGFDHRPLLEALRTGAGRYRGVALVRPQDPEERIAGYDAAGVRGARFNFLPHLGGRPDLDAVRTVAARVRVHDWHLAVHVAGEDIVKFESFLHEMSRQLRIVVDHMARVDLEAGPAGPGVAALRRLVDTGRVWVKLSGADRLSGAGAPFHDVAPLLRALVDHAPERVLWGSDWPHVNLSAPMPDDGALLNLALDTVPEAALRQKLFVGNPAALFGFA